MKKLLFGLLLFLFCMTSSAKDTIVYVFDPMCGWCFGFSEVIKKVAHENDETFYFDILSGGMVVGEREGPIGDFADYILGAYPRLEKLTGVKFGKPYLDQLKTKSIYSSSVIPSIAIEVCKELNLKLAIPFASALQAKYYVDGLDLREDTVYVSLAKQFGFNPDQFLTLLKSEEMKTRAFNSFKHVNALGVNGFPAVLAIKNGKWYALSNGYTDYESLKEALEKLKQL
jgi:putative protein-disulfide isomerase